MFSVYRTFDVHTVSFVEEREPVSLAACSAALNILSTRIAERASITEIRNLEGEPSVSNVLVLSVTHTTLWSEMVDRVIRADHLNLTIPTFVVKQLRKCILQFAPDVPMIIWVRAASDGLRRLLRAS